MACFSFFLPYALAQEAPEEEEIIDEIISDSISLFIPEKMITGETYEGMVTLLNPALYDSLAYIQSTDDYILEHDETVNILKNQNHGIFKITPLVEGETKLYVSFDGELTSSDTMIYSKTSGPQQLKVILPGNSTTADNLKGFVFLVDGNGSPIISDRDRNVSLTPSQKIITPPSITILNGTNHQVFDFTVRSTGTITATTSGLTSDTEYIEKHQDIIDVKMGIAPNIALEDSYTNYVIWLEKNGKPYTVNQSLKVELQSSNTQVVRFDITPESYTNVNTHIVTMRDGLASGKLFTGIKGISEIFVSIPGYGHTSSVVNVGPASLIDEEIIDEEYEGQFTELEPNYIEFWAYPNITDDMAYGIAALYHSVSTQELDISIDNGTQVTTEIEVTTLIPVKSDDTTFSVSSTSGLDYNSDYIMDGNTLSTNNKVFEIVAKNTGTYDITATGGGSSKVTQLQVTTNHDSSYAIQMVQLPTHLSMTQPLVMVSIIDEDGNIVDVSKIFGPSLRLEAHTIDTKIGSKTIKMNENVAIVSGMINGVSTITISSEKFGSTVTQLYPSGVPITIETYTPVEIHQGEPFPIIIHEVDALGFPINKIEIENVAASGIENIGNGLVKINDIGDKPVAILGQLGGAFQTHVNSFVNLIDFTMDSDINNARIGQDVTITIDSPYEGVNYTIQSPFPHSKLDDTTFVITPNHEIMDAEIVITGSLDGFTTIQKELLITSENIIEITTEAKTTDGKILSPVYEYILGNFTGKTESPHIHSIEPEQSIIIFPNEFSSGIGGYRLLELSIDGKTVDGNIVDFYPVKDVMITGVYDRFVNVVISTLR